MKIEWSEAATRSIVQHYTREAGVRTLEREIGSVCRKIARDVLSKGKDRTIRITPARVRKLLGVEKFRTNKGEKEPLVGTSTGLAWTQVGGEILQIEIGIMPGRGKLTITGKLGDVMQESAHAAMSYVRSRSNAWGHVPEGAMPKDGPSAGITICTALVSALTGIPVRHDVAMTGEITLRGNVLPIGGLKEKALAAHRAEINTILVPKENEKDLEEIPKSIAKEMTFHVVAHVDEVLKHALSLDNPDAFYEKARATTPFDLEQVIELSHDADDAEESPTVQ